MCHLVDGLCRVVSCHVRCRCGSLGEFASVDEPTRHARLEVTRCLDETRSVLFGSRREYGREIGKVPARLCRYRRRILYLHLDLERWSPPPRDRDPPQKTPHPS